MAVDVGSAVGYLDLDISGFLAGLKTAQSEADSKTRSMSSQIAGNLKGVGSALTTAGSTLTKSVTLPVVGAGTAVVKMSADFESAMSRVEAVSGASGDELEALNEKARELGATTEYSATQVADGMAEMAKAGWDATDIIDGMEGVLNAASASGEELASVSTIVADAITGFGLEAKDATKVADLLTQAANSGTIDINDLGESFKYISPVANSMGLSIEDTTTALAAMSTAGIKGSQAGTSLRTVLTKMAKPTKEVSEAMNELGLEITNSDGSFKDLDTILSEMRGKFSNMTEEQQAYYAATLAGQEGMSGLLAILGLTQEEYDNIAASMDNANGVAKETADTMLNNLSGQMTILKSSLEGLAIELGEALLPIIKDLVGWIQSLVEKFQAMTPEQKEQVVRWAMIAAAIGPVLLVLGKVISTIGSAVTFFSGLQGTMTTLTPIFTKIGAAIGGLAGPIAAVAAIIGVLVAAFATLWNTSEDFRNSIISIWEDIKSKVEEFTSGITERLNALGFDFESITDVLWTIWKGFCDLLAPIFIGVFDIISSVFGGVLDVLTGIFDVFIGIFTGNWEQAWNGIVGIFSGIWNALVGIFTGVFDAIGGVLDTILGWFGTSLEGVWEGITGFFTWLWETIVGFITGIPEMLTNLFTTIWTAITNFFTVTIPELFNSFLEFFATLPEKIGFIIGFIVGKIVQFGVDVWNWITTELPKIISGIVDWFAQLPGRIWEWLVETVTNIVNWGVDMFNTAVEWVSSTIDSVVEFFAELPGKIWEWLVDTVTGIVDWGVDMYEAASTAVTDTIDAIVEWFQELPGNLIDIGTNMVEGIWEGISGAWDWLWGQITGFCDGIVGGFMSALGIASPSKVLEKSVGIYLPPGISKGFEKAMPAATKSMKKELDSGISELQDGADVDVDVNAKVTTFKDELSTFYDSVSTWFGLLEDKFSKTIEKMIGTLREFRNISDSVIPAYNTGVVGSVNQNNNFDYKLLSNMLYDLLKKAPIQYNPEFVFEQGDVYLDKDKVGKSMDAKLKEIQDRRKRG